MDNMDGLKRYPFKVCISDRMVVLDYCVKLMNDELRCS